MLTFQRCSPSCSSTLRIQVLCSKSIKASLVGIGSVSLKNNERKLKAINTWLKQTRFLREDLSNSLLELVC
ncbi:unnamed protein product [Allacma fusca]|uniref:Uncharacterized protein n=1 Tax=Allacma fusca TaxID=39272 RepID=A0A8J2L052_9HEXA|nr:unnamed protein product [Allacma fusca]